MRKLFAEIIGQYIGQPFKPGGRGDGGWSCANLCHAILKDIGKHPPDEFGIVTIGKYHGVLTLDNYRGLIGDDIQLQQAITLRIVQTLGRGIAVNRILPGDLLMVRNIKNIAPAIYCGQGKAITSSREAGVIIFAIDNNNQVMLARRFE